MLDISKSQVSFSSDVMAVKGWDFKISRKASLKCQLVPGGNEVHPGRRRPLGGEAGGGAVEAQVHFHPLLSLHEKVRRSEQRVRMNFI